MGDKFLHFKCVAHIMNLIVSDVLKYLYDLVKNMRNVVRYVRSSPHCVQKFKDCAKHKVIEIKSLIFLDVRTRWNSSYMMLDSVINFSKAFDRLSFIDDAYIGHFLDGSEENHEGLPMDIN